MVIDYYFKRSGKTHVGTSEESEVFLDIGNNLCKGVIDHHQDENYKSTVDVLWDNICNRSGEYISHLIGKERITVITHLYPDTDAIASAYLLGKYLEIAHDSGKVADFVKDKKFLRIVEYVNKIDAGKNKTLKNIEGKPSIYALICLMANAVKNKEENTEEEISKKMMEAGICLFKKYYEKDQDDPWLSWEDVKSAVPDYSGLLSDGMNNDRRAYEEERESVEFRNVSFVNKNNNPIDKRVAIWHEKPKSEFGYLYARDEGAEITFVPKGKDNKVIISIKNESGENDELSLRPIAEIIELSEQVEEQEEYSQKGRFIRDHSSARKGRSEFPFSETMDPWYLTSDEQLLDSPRNGSKISIDQTTSILLSGGNLIKRFKGSAHSVSEITKKYDKKTQIDPPAKQLISYYRDELKKRREDYQLYMLETDTAIISHSNRILDIICMSIAGDSYTSYRNESFCHLDYRTSVYVSGRKVVIVYATERDEIKEKNKNNRIFDICEDRDDFDGIFDNISKSFEYLVKCDITLRKIADNMDAYFKDGKQSADGIGELARITAELQKNEPNDNPVLREIWDFVSDSLMIETRKNDITSSLELISSYKNEEATKGIKTFSDVIVPLICILTIVQAGMISLKPVIKSDSYGWSLVGWIAVIAVSIAMWLLLYKRKK